MTGTVSTGVRQHIEEISESLASSGIDAARAEAEGLVGAVLGIRQRHALYTEERDLTPEEDAALQDLVRRRLSGEPLQYITGEAAFRMLTLRSDRRALIPRPETEGMVDIALNLTGGRHGADVLDAGTGTGAIALSLAMEAPSWNILAVDRSEEALSLARENHERYGIGRIQWVQADFTRLSFWRGLPPLDLVISNPPYVADSEWDALPREIREHEPREAFVAGPEGLDIIEPLIEGAAMRVKPGGVLLVEIGETRSEAVQELARTRGFRDVRVAPDLSFKPRYLIAEQRHGEE